MIREFSGKNKKKRGHSYLLIIIGLILLVVLWDLLTVGIGLFVMGLFTLFFLTGSVKSLNQARRFADIPTSKIRSAAQGYVELRGLCYEPDRELVTAPLSGVKCAYWSLQLDKKDPSSRDYTWKIVDKATSTKRWLVLDDSTGICHLLPFLDSEITGETSIDNGTYAELSNSALDMNGTTNWSLAKMRKYFPPETLEELQGAKEWQITETRLPHDREIYAMGLFRTYKSNQLPWADIRMELEGARQEGKLSLINSNVVKTLITPTLELRDHQIERWQSYMRELEGVGPDQPLTGSHVVHTLTADDQNSRPMVLSVEPENNLIQSYYRESAIFLLIGIVLLGLMLFIIHSEISASVY